MDAEDKGKGTLKPERFTRAQAREMEAGAGAEEDEATQEGEIFVLPYVLLRFNVI